jgi:hypothetical protein
LSLWSQTARNTVREKGDTPAEISKLPERWSQRHHSKLRALPGEHWLPCCVRRWSRVALRVQRTAQRRGNGERQMTPPRRLLAWGEAVLGEKTFLPSSRTGERKKMVRVVVDSGAFTASSFSGGLELAASQRDGQCLSGMAQARWFRIRLTSCTAGRRYQLEGEGAMA